MGNTNKELDPFFAPTKRWSGEMSALRVLVLESELEEERKWYQPVYTLNGKNVMIVSSFKNHCVLSFFKGVLLKDPHKLLVSPGEQSQSVRVLRFTSTDEIHNKAHIIRAYIAEAIANEKAGRTIKLKSIAEREVPEELQTVLKKNPKFKIAFDALPPGRRRMYLMHVGGAKQASTRIARAQKCMEEVLGI